MSETRHYKGSLKEVNLGDLSIEQFAKQKTGGGKLDSWFDSYAEKLMEDDEYLIHDGKLYEVTANEMESDNEMFEMHKDGDVLKFEVMYYDGGCSFEEAIQEAFKELGK